MRGSQIRARNCEGWGCRSWGGHAGAHKTWCARATVVSTGVTLGAGGASRQTAEFGDEGVLKSGAARWRRELREAGARGGCRAGHVSYLVHAIRYPPISRVVPRAAPCVPRPRPRAVFSLIHVDSACMMYLNPPESRQPSPPSLPGPRRAVTANTPRPSNRSPYGAARARRARRAARPRPKPSPSSPALEVALSPYGTNGRRTARYLQNNDYRAWWRDRTYTGLSPYK